MLRMLRQRFQSSLRYKLLVLVLLPLVCAMAVTLGYALYWLYSQTQETLILAMRDDQEVARHALRQLQDEFQLELQRLAESTQFRAQLKSDDSSGIRRTLQSVRTANGFAFLHVTGVAGNWLFETADNQRTSKTSPLADRAARGFAGAALEVFRPEDLRREDVALAQRAQIPLRGSDDVETRGLALRLVQPITDEDGRVWRILDAAVMLNRNSGVLDIIGQRVFGADILPSGAEPIVGIVFDGTRIAVTTSRVGELLGERVSAGLRAQVTSANDLWTGHDLLAREDYVSAYGPLFDVNGQRVGMLHVGVREAAFRTRFYGAAGLLLSLCVAATGLAAWMAVRGVRSVIEPIETMAAVARATQAGEDRRVGPINSKDEIGQLGRQVDVMLDQLAARSREIQRGAAALEVKVAERTQELAESNAQLRETIALLEKTREQLVTAEKLSALGQMAAGIAHEINNPAAVILGNLDVLSKELGEHAAPVAREIELIAQQVERIRHIVTSLRQFARARPGEGAVTVVNVNQLVADVLPLVEHVIKAKSIALKRRLGARSTVAVNAFDIEQVLINLIVNAANACPAGGAIEIVTEDWGNGSAISVRDNGRGIPRDQMNRIFDPFFTTDTRNGVGLGLSVSYGLVCRYGGHLSVESEPGTGSVFKVWLLRRPVAGAGDAIRQSEEASYG